MLKLTTVYDIYFSLSYSLINMSF